MEFINKPNFEHSFFNDIVRINYNCEAAPQVINDFGYSYIMIRYGYFEARNNQGEYIAIPRIFTKCTGDFFSVKAATNSSWISIELPNGAFHNITKLITKNQRNKLIDLYDYIPAEILDTLYVALENENEIEKITALVDKSLESYYSNWMVPLDSQPMVDYIFNKKGLLETIELSEKFPFSSRTIERIFHKEVGASPYRFICLVRFNHIIRELLENKYDSIDSLTKDYEYFDQSHFEKDFKKFMGQGVKQYKDDFNPLLTKALSRVYHETN
ncbi:Helix-turn-helix domain-containing protein [Bizionia echini]|uniref:Helix-turn-helix domain-containing protein n=1 Tax=Bizionia echini TaxID=649333 RepID=A0A1I5AGS4_9FLAO|nr:helix-turn-helix domain-containing protein [Bizionia echini]SFN61681.1 Helix-turn-helix domain-containing protein [Bizionia echini]